MSNQLPNTITVDKGTIHHHKLDRVSSETLHLIQALHRREFGFRIKKDFIIRRAFRGYLEYLTKGIVTPEVELKGLTSAIEGRA
ncbi:hypothetical protein KP005_11975 [Geomonas nitrogeniifigens]|uniref:Uncharacterized protein n=1 Tax=Geomonas diazotrophica TaxID=2843197 RepID=A0ABX8JCF2_9BACT|nr:hypothetical protein [Geomonas nitrogeniifigens]QWV96098.1 hypothetical protein KP005_11975 [Geomonas nitrogeniifigens]